MFVFITVLLLWAIIATLVAKNRFNHVKYEREFSKQLENDLEQEMLINEYHDKLMAMRETIILDSDDVLTDEIFEEVLLAFDNGAFDFVEEMSLIRTRSCYINYMHGETCECWREDLKQQFTFFSNRMQRVLKHQELNLTRGKEKTTILGLEELRKRLNDPSLATSIREDIDKEREVDLLTFQAEKESEDSQEKELDVSDKEK